jgi:ABC-2 type transport system ATP-binding protein
MTLIQFVRLTKRYGPVTAVDDLTADIAPGRITAFLGANGSGKTTSIRALLALTHPTSGQALVDGRPYGQLTHPMSTVGAVLDQGFHPHRSARNHLRISALQAGMPAARVDDVTQLVGLAEVTHRKVGGFSLGQRQRLALAAALIGEPSALIMDEPFNGLDPAGITTLREFLRGFANQGGTVLLSSHLLAEIEHCADEALIIDHGRLMQAGPIDSLIPKVSAISVASPRADRLAVILGAHGATLDRVGSDELIVWGLTAEQIGQFAAHAGIIIVGMTAQGRDLESLFASLTTSERSS